jgi:hypothetical protein
MVMVSRLDRATLQAALVGYQQQLADIQTKMTELRRRLGHAPAAAPARAPSASAAPSSSGRKHRMSAEGRARIAAAQRARWAKFKKKSKAA